jgi:UV DNA damage endonuclease
MIRHIGYACVNTQLQAKKVKMSTARKSTIDAGGEEVITDLILSNLDSLYKILEWNHKKKIKFFRMGSELFPWLGTYDIRKFKRFDEIEYNAGFVGEYAREKRMRLTFHPGPFNVLCSPNEEVVEKTIKELDAHSEIFDLMGFAPSFDNKINIHVGGAYDDKEATLKRWVQNWRRLKDSTRQRVVVENDDKSSMFAVTDLMQLHKMCNKELPITFDFFHHKFHTGGMTENEALDAAVSTWPKGVVPATHYSESRREEKVKIITDIFRNNRIPWEDLEKWPTFKEAYDFYSHIKYQAHSDYVDGPIDSHGHTIDVMIEAKMKEQAVFGLRDADTVRKLRAETPLLNG